MTQPDAGVVIRRFREEEWELWRELRLRALATDPLAFGSWLAREQAFDDATWKSYAHRGGEAGTSPTWIAIGPDGRWVGSAIIAEFEGAVHLFAMWLDPAFRGRGIGGAMLDAALEGAATQFPGQPVQLEANPDQTAAIQLYRSRGFRPTGAVGRLEHTPSVTTVMMERPAQSSRK
jgi:ribosomal protein S18 acetylase RimI-like enzyme